MSNDLNAFVCDFEIDTLEFIKITPENPVLSLRLETEWTGMKGVSAKGRKKLNQMLKRY
jgi:hypothetical protein